MNKIKNTSGFTIVEIIIALSIVAVVFAGLFSGISFISAYVRDSNIKLNAMNLSKTAIEKLNVYVDYNIKNGGIDSWNNLMTINSNFGTGYFIFSGSQFYLNKITESELSDFSKWEGPLDNMGNKKTNTNGISYYRILKIRDYDVSSKQKESSIFDVYDNEGYGVSLDDKNVSKEWLSNPYLQNTSISGNNLTLKFSTGTIFNDPSLFVRYLGSGTLSSLSSNFNIYSTGKIDNVGDIIYLKYPSSISNQSLTLSGETEKAVFSYIPVGTDIGVSSGSSLDEGIFNMYNAINENLEEFKAYILYPNSCNIRDKITLFDTESKQKYKFSLDAINKCNNPSVSIISNSIILSGSVISNLKPFTHINPTYLFKFGTGNTYKLFSDLKSPRITKYGVDTYYGTGASSIYSVGVRVVGLDNGKIVVDESFKSYITDL